MTVFEPTAPAPEDGDARPDSQRIIEAMLARVARQGWTRTALADIADEAGLPILRVYRTFRSKQAILCGLAEQIDETVLADPITPEPDERPRDRIFDLLMRRFDALQPYKPGFAVLRRELARDPPAAIAAASSLLHSMAWMLEAAGIPAQGVRGIIAVKLTTTAYVAVQRVWLRDDSPDLAQTMAELDRRLRSVERWYIAPRIARTAPEAAPT